MPTKQYNMVREFMAFYGQPLPRDFVDANNDTARLRADLIEEEHREYWDAFPMSAELLDGLVDILYVTYGAVAALGLTLRETELPGVHETSIKKIGLANEAARCVTELRKSPLCRVGLEPALNVLIRAAWAAGLTNAFDMEGAFSAVHSANMAKTWTAADIGHCPHGFLYATRLPDGRYINRNASGKVIKPPRWVAPNLAKYVNEALARLAPPGAHTSASTASTDPVPDPRPVAPPPPPALATAQGTRKRKARIVAPNP